ncbi:hypothetical protein ACROYT_G001502 [Oculina patagonica]
MHCVALVALGTTWVAITCEAWVEAIKRGYKATLSAILLMIMETEGNSEEKIQQETRGTENPDTKEQTPTREITQTDHLNRRLLDAFLTRLNSSESTEVLPTNVQQMEINDGQEFENDQNSTDHNIVGEQSKNESKWQ